MSPTYFISRTIRYFLIIGFIFGTTNFIGNIIQLQFTDYSKLKTTTILIIGDSQTETSINDKLIPHSLNLSASGDPIFHNYIKLKHILNKENKIDTIILGFSPTNMISKGFHEVPKGAAKYLAYCHLFDFSDYKFSFIENWKASVKGVVTSISNLSLIKYPLKGEKIPLNRIGGYLRLPEKALDKNEDSSIVSLRQYSPGELQNNINTLYLNKIIDLCNSKGIKLIILNTPVTNKKKHELSLVYPEYLKYINQFKEITLIDYYKDENCNLGFSYYDANHLCGFSSDLFTFDLKKKMKMH